MTLPVDCALASSVTQKKTMDKTVVLKRIVNPAHVPLRGSRPFGLAAAARPIEMPGQL